MGRAQSPKKWNLPMNITTLNTAEAKEQFSDLVNRVIHNKERVILTRRGKEVAVIIPIEDMKLLQESQDKLDLREATEILKEARANGTITLDQLKDEIGS